MTTDPTTDPLDDEAMLLKLKPGIVDAFHLVDEYLSWDGSQDPAAFPMPHTELVVALPVSQLLSRLLPLLAINRLYLGGVLDLLHADANAAAGLDAECDEPGDDARDILIPCLANLVALTGWTLCRVVGLDTESVASVAAGLESGDIDFTTVLQTVSDLAEQRHNDSDGDE